MSERLTARLYNASQGVTWLVEAFKLVKATLLAGGQAFIEILIDPQSRDQQEKYHAMIGEIADQAKHLGATWDDEDWKRLLLDKFSKETGRKRGRIIPNLDGDGVVEVGVQSRKFSKKVASEFIEWLHAWGAENGIEYSDAWQVDPETGEIA